MLTVVDTGYNADTQWQLGSVNHKTICTTCLELNDRLRKGSHLDHRHQGRADCIPLGPRSQLCRLNQGHKGCLDCGVCC